MTAQVSPWTLGNPGLPGQAATLPPPPPPPPAQGAKLLRSGTQLTLTQTLVQAGVRFLAVDPDGTAYATLDGQGQEQLWASEDNARTWTRRGQPLSGLDFRNMTALKSGTLLADVEQQLNGVHFLMRSDDHGASWTQVLSLGTMTTLTPHSFDEDDGTIFAGEYQAYTQDSVPVHLWVSVDDGRTWAARHTFDDRRHAHAVRVNPFDHSLWIFFGDNEMRTGIARSTDGGYTFQPLVTGHEGSAVDAVFTDLGALFGNDIVYGSVPSSISVLGSNDMPHPMYRLPGPSYSIHETPVGGLLLGTTREPGGDVYLPNDDSAHLLASADGVNWTDVFQFARVDLTGYARVNVYWTLPSGEMVVQLAGVQPIGSGYGYALVKVEAN